MASPMIPTSYRNCLERAVSWASLPSDRRDCLKHAGHRNTGHSDSPRPMKKNSPGAPCSDRAERVAFSLPRVPLRTFRRNVHRKIVEWFWTSAPRRVSVREAPRAACERISEDGRACLGGDRYSTPGVTERRCRITVPEDGSEGGGRPIPSGKCRVWAQVETGGGWEGRERSHV